MGDAGLTFRDFCILTFDELQEILRVCRERREERIHDDWERMRMHAAITMQPHCKKRLDPKRLIRFPWDSGQKNSTRILNKDQAKEAFLARIRKG